jgi:hypothetical protein
MLIGAVMLIGFVMWEMYGTKYPMFPGRIKQDPRILLLTLVITFISGANFFSVLLFWPTQAFNVYGHDPIGVGLRGMPIGFCILGGACIVLVLISHFRGGNRIFLFISSCLMTAGCAGLAGARIDNINAVYGILVVAGLGIGGIVLPASIITTIICPDDLIATVTALTLAVRVIITSRSSRKSRYSRVLHSSTTFSTSQALTEMSHCGIFSSLPDRKVMRPLIHLCITLVLRLVVWRL